LETLIRRRRSRSRWIKIRSISDFCAAWPKPLKTRRGPWQIVPAFAEALVLLLTGTWSGRGVNEAGHGSAEDRRRRNRPGRVDHDDKVRPRRNYKGVRGAPKCWSQTDDSAIAQVVLAQVCWIVAVQICGALDIASASERSIDCDSEAGFRSA